MAMSEDPFDVTVLGTSSPPVGGCVIKSESKTYHGFNMWLGNAERGFTSCNDDENMDYYNFECVSSLKEPIIIDNKNWTFVALYDLAAYKFDRPPYRCLLYETSDNISFRITMSGDGDCYSFITLAKKPLTFGIMSDKSWWNGMMIMEWKKNVRRVKKVIRDNDEMPVPIGSTRIKRQITAGCRFPEWSQGKWVNLNVNEDMVDYIYSFFVEDSEEDIVDYGDKGIGNEGKHSNTETTRLGRVQQHASISMNEYTPSINRNRRSSNSTKYSLKLTHPTVHDNVEPYVGIADQYTIMERMLEELELRFKRPAGPTPPPSPPPTPPNTPPNSPPRNPIPFNPPKKYDFHEPINKGYIKLTQRKHDLNNRNKRSNLMNNDEMTPLTQKPRISLTKFSDAMETLSPLGVTPPQQYNNLNLFDHIYGDGNHELKMMTPDQRQFKDILSTPNEKPIETTFDYKSPKIEKPFLIIDNQEEIRNKRSVDEDDDEEDSTKVEYDDEEAELEQTRIAEKERIEKLNKWWDDFRSRAMIEYQNRWRLATRLDKDYYNMYPERRPVPSPVDYLQLSEVSGVPYKEAVIRWRELERAHRMWRAEVEYVLFPEKNSPDVVMEDFDMTFKDIEYDFDPQYPEGTSKDPTVYRAYTLPGGYRIASRMSRRQAWDKKQARASSIEFTLQNNQKSKYITSGSKNNLLVKTKKKISRRKRGLGQHHPKNHPTSHFKWRCVMPVDSDNSQPQDEGVKFLTLGGEVVDEVVSLENGQNDGNEAERVISVEHEREYGCLWMVPRGPNIIEFAILGVGTPSSNKSEDLQKFAQFLCTNETKYEKELRVKHNVRPPRRSWITETRPQEINRVPVACPVQPGTEFYGIVPAPPPPSKAALNAAVAASFPNINITPSSSIQLCAMLISSANDCVNGQSDKMKYTVSECMDQNDTTATASILPKIQTVFEEREYQCLGQWSEVQPQANPITGLKPMIFTYTYVLRVDPVGYDAPQYECFVGTSIPNDDGKNTETTTTLLLTEAGVGNKCSRWANPHKSGMKLVGTTNSVPSSCATYARSPGSWYPLKPQQVSPSDNGGGKWVAAGPVPIRNGASTPRQQGHQHQTGAPPKQDNNGVSNLRSRLPPTILMGLLAVAANHLFFLHIY